MKIRSGQLKTIRPIGHKKRCPLCGLENKKMYGNCTYCNADMGGVYQNPQAAQSRRVKRPLFLFTLLFIIIILLVIYNLFRYWSLI